MELEIGKTVYVPKWRSEAVIMDIRRLSGEKHLFQLQVNSEIYGLQTLFDDEITEVANDEKG